MFRKLQSYLIFLDLYCGFCPHNDKTKTESPSVGFSLCTGLSPPDVPDRNPSYEATTMASDGDCNTHVPSLMGLVQREVLESVPENHNASSKEITI